MMELRKQTADKESLKSVRHLLGFTHQMGLFAFFWTRLHLGAEGSFYRNK